MKPGQIRLKSEESSQEEGDKFELVKSILQGDSYIDPLNPDEITRAYAAFDRNPQKMVHVLVNHFQSHCRKVIRNSALIEHKNEISNSLQDEADVLRQEVTQKIFDKVKKDPQAEQLLKMLIFKNSFWKWIRFGLKEIFEQQRSEPGHELNKHVHTRYQLLKKRLNLKHVGEVVAFDIVEIINLFKQEMLKKETKIFPQ